MAIVLAVLCGMYGLAVSIFFAGSYTKVVLSPEHNKNSKDINEATLKRG